MQAVEVLGDVVTVFGVGMGASTLLQARRIIKRRRSDDVSVAMLLVLISGSVLWLAYGFAHDLTAVIATNGTWLVGASFSLAVTLRYRQVAKKDADPNETRVAETSGARREGSASESATIPTSTDDH